MMAYGPIPGCQVMSDLLTIREKGILITLLEPHCKCFISASENACKREGAAVENMLIKTTVAQILQAKVTGGESSTWHRLACGVVCLIEDESIHSHFLRLYCVKRTKLLWEQEIYIPFQYTASRSYFHTFPAEVHQVGLNFANEVEAEEFHLAVKTVHEKMTKMVDMTKVETVSSSSNDKPHLGNQSMEKINEVKDFTLKAPLTTASPSTSSFKDLEATMRRLLIQARLSEEDLKEKNVAEAVDCIINKFGGLHAVQRELRTRGAVSQTLPRATGTSISHASQRKPMSRVPSISNCTTSEQGSLGSATLNRSQFGSSVPSLPPVPAPKGKRKSASFKLVSSKDKGDLMVTALREVFRQKQMIQQKTTEDANQVDLDTNND